MPKAPSSAKVGGIGSQAVAAKTGKGWHEWIRILDAAGARTMAHKGIVVYLRQHHGVEPWWHQTAESYQASASKTVSASARALFAAWTDEAVRRRWLPEARSLKITTATPAKSIRATWGEGRERLDVMSTSKALPVSWKQKLQVLQALVEIIGLIPAGRAMHRRRERKALRTLDAGARPPHCAARLFSEQGQLSIE